MKIRLKWKKGKRSILCRIKSCLSVKEPVDVTFTLYLFDRVIRCGVGKGCILYKRYLYGVVWLVSPESKVQRSAVPKWEATHIYK